MQPYLFQEQTNACTHALQHGMKWHLCDYEIVAGSHVTQSGSQDETANLLLAALDCAGTPCSATCLLKITQMKRHTAVVTAAATASSSNEEQRVSCVFESRGGISWGTVCSITD